MEMLVWWRMVVSVSGDDLSAISFLLSLGVDELAQHRLYPAQLKFRDPPVSGAVTAGGMCQSEGQAAVGLGSAAKIAAR